MNAGPVKTLQEKKIEKKIKDMDKKQITIIKKYLH